MLQVAGTMSALQQLLDANPPCPEFRPLEVLMIRVFHLTLTVISTDIATTTSHAQSCSCDACLLITISGIAVNGCAGAETWLHMLRRSCTSARGRLLPAAAAPIRDSTATFARERWRARQPAPRTPPRRRLSL